MSTSIFTTPDENLKRIRQSWAAMIYRCHDPRSDAYENYGGRGVYVHPEWRYSFEAFYAYVGQRPGPGYSLDRWPNPEGNYEPGNVRWATQPQQCRNRRDSLKIFYNGEERVLAEVCAEIGFSHNVAKSRFFKDWLDRDLFLPVGRQGRKMQTAGTKNVPIGSNSKSSIEKLTHP
jgi:hypothetical protein